MIRYLGFPEISKKFDVIAEGIEEESEDSEPIKS